MTPEEYLADARPACVFCLEPRDDVRPRFDPYHHELHDDETLVNICDPCARERYQET